MNRKQIKQIEWKIIICVVLLLAIGLIALYSATNSTDFEEFKKQIIWILISIQILICTIVIDYKTIAKFALPLYIISIIFLGVVLLTTKINGASSWFNLGFLSLQPSELSKVTVILFIATIITKLRKEYGASNK